MDVIKSGNMTFGTIVMTPKTPLGVQYKIMLNWQKLQWLFNWIAVIEYIIMNKNITESYLSNTSDKYKINIK